MPPKNGLMTIRSRDVLVLLIVLTAAFSTRLLPLAMSPYPFNNDSLTEISISEEILETGHIDYTYDLRWNATHNLVTPALDAMLAFFASATGLSLVQCGQILAALIAMSTVGILFLLGRIFSGDLGGALVAAFAGIMFGTFVFTTGSVWKIMLGFNLLAFVLLTFVGREKLSNRLLVIPILLVLPLAHHLTAAVAYIVLLYLVMWSWHYGIVNKAIGRRHHYDLLLIAVPGGISLIYYASTSFNRLVEFTNPRTLAILITGFLFLSVVAALVLSQRRHVRWSFAPFVALAVGAFFLLDYLGFIFPYASSASELYILLISATALLTGLAWYGTELLIESHSAFRAVQVGLIVAPMAIVSYGILIGSMQVMYRSFDLLDIFLFLGCAVGLVHISKTNKRLYRIVGAAFVVLIALSFPFGYASGPLLGVRHDTQSYEMDAFGWLEGKDHNITVIADERLAYIARSTYGYTAGPSMPYYLVVPPPFPEYQWYFVVEDSWTKTGVNYYPQGTFVADPEDFRMILEASNVLYVGGPEDDRLSMFLPSSIGGKLIYPQESSV